MPKVQALYFRPGQRLHIGEGQRTPERRGREAIGQAAAERKCGAVGAEPVAVILRKQRSALAIQSCPRSVRAQLRVDQAIEVESERVVVVELRPLAVTLPAFADV